jgi:hypothetical protein
MRWGLMLQGYNLSIKHIIILNFPNNVTLFIDKQYLEIFRTYQIQGQN